MRVLGERGFSAPQLNIAFSGIKTGPTFHRLGIASFGSDRTTRDLSSASADKVTEVCLNPRREFRHTSDPRSLCSVTCVRCFSALPEGIQGKSGRVCDLLPDKSSVHDGWFIVTSKIY